MSTHRRKEYNPASKFPVYHKWFDYYQMKSLIISSGNEIAPSISTIMWDKGNTESMICQYVGDKNGLFRRADSKEGEGYVALIPGAKEELAEIEKDFKRYKRQRINQGYEAPEEMPLEMLNRKYQHEAKLDAHFWELELLEAKLKTYTDVLQKVSDENVLVNGLICSGCFHGIGTSWYNPAKARAVLDGQNLTMVEEGFLIIDDKRSPYNQMRVSDYHKLAKQWVKDRMAADAAKLKQMRSDAKQKGLILPRLTGTNMNAKINKADLPPFPDWAIKYEPTPKDVERTKFPDSGDVKKK